MKSPLLCVLLGVSCLLIYAATNTTVIAQTNQTNPSSLEDSPTQEQLRQSYLRWQEEIRTAQDQERQGNIQTALDHAQNARKTAESIPDFNMYEYQGNILFIIRLLERQKKFTEASLLAEEIANKPQGVVVTEPAKWLNIAIADAANSGQADEVYRLQRLLLQFSNAWPEIWSIDKQNNQLNYALANLSFPLSLDGWVLAGLEPADKRDSEATLTYMHKNASDDAAVLQFTITYSEPDYRDPDTAQDNEGAVAQDNIQSWRKYAAKSEQSATAYTLPQLHFPDSLAADALEIRSKDDQQVTDFRARWAIARGEWMLEASANVYQDKLLVIMPEIKKLFAAVQWNKPPKLHGKITMKQQLDELSVVQLRGAEPQWDKIAQQVTQVMNEARFPYEWVQLYGLEGMAQYRLNNLQQAHELFGKMLELKKYSRNDSYSIYDSALEYAADTAWKLDDAVQWKTLDKARIKSKFFTDDWSFAQDDTVISSQKYDLMLPIRLGDFYLQMNSETIFRYQNLKENKQVWINISDPQSPQQIEANFKKLLGAGIIPVEKTNAVPISLAKGSFAASGTLWVFDVLDRDNPTQVFFITIPRKNDLLYIESSIPKKEGPDTKSAEQLFIEQFVWRSVKEPMNKSQ